jgi:amino acid transporter
MSMHDSIVKSTLNIIRNIVLLLILAFVLYMLGPDRLDYIENILINMGSMVFILTIFILVAAILVLRYIDWESIQYLKMSVNWVAIALIIFTCLIFFVSFSFIYNNHTNQVASNNDFNPLVILNNYTHDEDEHFSLGRSSYCKINVTDINCRINVTNNRSISNGTKIPD